MFGSNAEAGVVACDEDLMVTGEDDDNHDKGGEMFVFGKAGGLE